MAVFWVVAPCSLVEVYQRFRGPCCLHCQGDDYTALQPRWQLSSYSPPWESQIQNNSVCKDEARNGQYSTILSPFVSYKCNPAASADLIVLSAIKICLQACAEKAANVNHKLHRSWRSPISCASCLRHHGRVFAHTKQKHKSCLLAYWKQEQQQKLAALYMPMAGQAVQLLP
jgi:hypothetical protein